MTVLAPARATHPHQAGPAAQSQLGRIAGFSLRHRKAVLAVWFAFLVAGGAAAGTVQKRLNFDFSMPGQPGYETAVKILHLFGNGGDVTPSVAVVTVPTGQTVAGDEQALAAAFDAVRAARGAQGLRVIDLGSTRDRRFVTDDGRSTFALLYSPPAMSFGANRTVTTAAAILARRLPGYRVGLTGLEQLSSGSESKGPGVLAETLFGAAGALAVLAFVFASFLALLPMVIAAVSILTTFLLVLGVTYITGVSFIVEFLIALVGLGVAIDYSLLYVTRWREERARGRDNAAAVVTAAGTAGRAVVLSGLTVAVSLMALIVLPVPSLRSVGIGGMLIPLVSVVVVNTLLPALLGGVGPRVDWPRIRHEHRASPAWSAWGRAVVRWRWAAAGFALVLLGLFAAPALHIKAGESAIDALAKNGPAYDGYRTLAAGGVPSGVLTPVEVLTTAGATPAVLDVLDHTPGVATAVLPSSEDGCRARTCDIVAIPDVATLNNISLAPVQAIEHAVDGHPGVIGVAGEGAVQQDFGHAVFGNFPLMFSLIALVSFLLLARALRSPLLAAKAVVLNLVSLAATFGVLTWFWQEGHGSHAIFSIPPTGAITFWIPLMVFAFLFGLSMDYEVFILTRVREEYDRTGSTDGAMTEGLARTGRLVTSAALILFLAFASLTSAPNTDVKVLATGLGAGILLDATVIRALLVPALVSLFGRANWWLPRPLAKVLALRSPARADGH